MTKQDWRNEKDYAYTKNLDNKGWAWEFIRRRDDYRTEYARCKRQIEQIYKGDWSKEEPVVTPLDKTGLSRSAVRLKRNLAKIQRVLTPTQQAAARWGLWAMYDPAMVYDSLMVKFDLTNPFPAFYAGRLDKETGDRGNTKDIQDFSELFKPKPQMKDADIVFVAFDTRRPLSDQYLKTKKVLERYQDKKCRLVNSSKLQKAGFPLYIRMLDAVEDNEKALTLARVIQELDPHKKIKGKDSPTYKEWDKYGRDTLNGAKAVRDGSYQSLLFKIRNTD